MKKPVGRNVFRLAAVSLVILLIFLWVSFSPTKHDPLWHTVLNNNNRKNETVGAKHVVSPADPFALVKGVDYFADYDIYNVSMPLPGEDYDDGHHPEYAFRYINQSTSEFKFRWISSRPRIALIPNFLSVQECDDLINEAKPKLFRSQVAEFGKGSSKQDEVRTSSQTWLDISQGTAKVVADRALKLTGFPPGSPELLQILRYDVGQKYNAHNDYFDPALYGPQTTNRAVTVFYYLNSVDEGGQTWFPDADGKEHETRDYVSCKRGMGFKPKKGYAVVFYDMTPNRGYDPLSLHGACPVIRGTKWGGTLWLRVPVGR